jgi:DNA repair photolyase
MTPPAPIRKGRGALTNAAGRYEPRTTDPFDDGWSEAGPLAEKVETIVAREAAKSIISYNDSPDLSFDRTINPYRGCEHGCVYCYARPNHAYAGLSPGLDFETRIFAKDDAPALLENELSAKDYVCRPIVLGGVTDVYQPAERERRLTRAIVEVLAAHRHPFGVVTKSALVLRDLDLIAPMAADGLVKIAISVTSLDPKLARTLEPRAAAPHRRIETIRALAAAGVPVSVMAAPLIPALNDHEIEAILEAAAGAGAREAGYVALRLPLEIKELFEEWLRAHAPDRADRVLALVRQMRGGRLYDARWGERQRGTGPYAQLMARRFHAACARLGLNALKLTLDTTLFRRPSRPGDQLALL